MTPTDPVAEKARQRLERFVDKYEGMDMGGGDPVHAARVRAQEALAAGPKPSDPFAIAEIMLDALPMDAEPMHFLLSWLDEYVKELQQL